MTKTLLTAARLLTFRSRPDELRRLDYRHLVLGLLCTWLVGMGRWWEDPRAGLLQHLGIGSVAYVFILAFFLWLVIWPLTPPHWSFLNIIIFVSLTSPPALLYAIPVRHGLAVPTAQTVRLWMLAVVAGWRVALLVFYLHHGAGLTRERLSLAAIFPLLLIVFTLTNLNLEQVVFEFMRGVRPTDRSVNDEAYSVLFLLSLISMLAFLPLLASYLFLSVNSVISKYGPRWGGFFYGLSLVLVASGVGWVWHSSLAFLGAVFIGAGLVTLFATWIKLKESANP